MDPGVKLKPVSKQFAIDGQFEVAVPFGTGHINNTYRVSFSQGKDRTDFIFQQMNSYIFSKIPEMMDNISRVTRHIREKLKNRNEYDIQRRVLTIIPTTENRNFYIDTENNYWRVYNFISNARTYDVLTDTDQAFEVARMYGEFLSQLTDLPGPPLHETISGFHDGQKRFAQFNQALITDKHNRAGSAKTEIEFLQKNSWIFNVLSPLIKEGKVPFRISHNDTKVNNILIDNTKKKAICVLDLDTVMPGLLLYDFGDLARSSLSATIEDERDLSKIRADTDRFSAILAGYMSSAGQILTTAEKENLILSTRLISLLIGTRFLTDYLDGDKYFRTCREGQNLDRCRAQFKLIYSIIENSDKMTKIVENIIKDY